jgi:hypothetical protein
MIRIGKIRLVFFALVIFFAGAKNIWAAELDNQSKGVSITPFLREIDLAEDKQEESFPVTVENNSASSVQITFSVADFGSLDETGGILFLGSEKSLANKYNLASWVELSDSAVTLASGEKRSVTVKIINKDDLSPGGHYGMLVASVENITNGGENAVTDIKLNSKVTSLIFLRKTGGEIYALGIRKERKETTFFSLPKKLRLYFENTGNVHVTSRGFVSVLDPWGREIERGIINVESGIILPGSSRVLPVDLMTRSMAFFPGKYKLVIQYRYDGRDDFMVMEDDFFFFPVVAGVGVGIIFLLSVYAIVGWLIKKRK